MNTVNFQSKFKLKKFPLETDTENQDDNKKYINRDDQSSLEYQSISQINKVPHYKKNYTNTSSNNKNSLTGEKSNLIQRNLSNSVIQAQQKRSPEFAKKSNYTQRKFSQENNIKSISSSEKQYQIIITPPKESKEESKFYRNNINVKKQKQPEKKKVIQPTIPLKETNFTPPKRSQTRSQIELSIYNESIYKMKKIKRDEVNLIVSNVQKRFCHSPIKPRETIKQEAEKIINQTKRGTKKYLDSLFPANSSIIFNNKINNQEEEIKFERIRKIYDRHPIKLYKYCDAAVIIPGKYTSPNFFSAISILAEQPTRVANIFHNQQINNQGIYYANLCKDGVWRYVIVDDLLPIRINKKKFLLFTHTTNQNSEYQIWPGILEKCLAKLYGTYEDIVLTKSEGIKNIMRTFTGFPFSQYNITNSLRSYLIIIQNSIKQNHIVVLEKARQSQQDYIQKFKALNLNPQHSYQVSMIKNNEITLKNNLEFQGEKTYQLQDLQIFSRILIFKSHENYVYISRTLRHKLGFYSELQITVKQNTQCYFDIWQLNPIYFKSHLGSQINYTVAPFVIEIQDTAPNSIEDIIYLKQSGKQIQLHASTYRLRIHVCLKKEYDFTLSYYGENEIQMKRIKVLEKWSKGCC